jgi:hypothetical protein
MNDLSAIQIPRGLADPHGKFAYVVGPQGLIYRLDLKTGKNQAYTKDPGTPLAIQDEMLIGWAPSQGTSNAVRLFAVVQDGDVLDLVWEQALALPTWVEVGSLEPDRFSLEAEILDEELVVTWQARSRYAGGAPPSPEVEAAETRDASRIVYINPKTGTVLREEHKDSVALTQEPLPDLPANWSIVPYLQGESWATRPWSVNAGNAFLVKTAGEPGILLVRREAGNAARTVETRLTQDPAAVASVTPDGKFVFIHEARNDPASWHVYSGRDGERIAKLPFDPGTQGVSVVGEQVLYLVIQEQGQARPTSLRSRELHTGQEMWSFTIEDGAARTPPKPRGGTPPPPAP